MNEAVKRGYKKVIQTVDNGGWEVGDVSYWKETSLHTPMMEVDRCYNEDCSEYRYATPGVDCKFVEETQ